MSVPDPRGPSRSALAVPLAVRPPQQGRAAGASSSTSYSRAAPARSRRRAARSSSESTTRCATSARAQEGPRPRRSRDRRRTSRGATANPRRPRLRMGDRPRRPQQRAADGLPPLYSRAGRRGARRARGEGGDDRALARRSLVSTTSSTRATSPCTAPRGRHACGRAGDGEREPDVREPDPEQDAPAHAADDRRSQHSQPGDAAGVVAKVREIPRRTGPAGDGYDGLASCSSSTARTTAHSRDARDRPPCTSPSATSSTTTR